MLLEVSVVYVEDFSKNEIFKRKLCKDVSLNKISLKEVVQKDLFERNSLKKLS